MNTGAKGCATTAVAAVCLSLAAVCAAPATGRISLPFSETYTGNITYFGGVRGSVQTTFTITIESYTPDSEVQRLISVLQNDGQDAAMRLLSKEKRGKIQLGTRLGRDINAAWVTPGEEGERRITVIAERWIGFAEARRGTRSLDYPFTFAELFIDSRGRGDGGLIPAAKLRSKRGNVLEAEDFGIWPARLTNVRRRD
jgi:hypothetical protein